MSEKIIVKEGNGEKDGKGQKGQTLVEFLLLFIAMMTLSFILIFGMGNVIGERWRALVSIISDQDLSGINLN